jgi:hypothetical protein
MQELTIVHCNSVEEANFKGYNKEGKYKHAIPIVLTELVVVANGTEEGHDTVDLVLKSPEGHLYVAMVTKNLLKTAIGV